MTATIGWDRRVFVAHEAPAECSGNDTGNGCALGLAVEPGSVTTGVLTVCTDTSTTPGGGYCSEADTEHVPITVDLNQSAADIDVQ
jgi:hypothetical protein